MSDTGIDGCISKINDLRENARELSGLLAPIQAQISNEEFLRSGALEQAAGLMGSHSGLLKSLEAEMMEVSPEIRPEGRYDGALEALEKKLMEKGIEIVLEALEKFQRVNINDPQIKEVLVKCQKEASGISKTEDIQEIIRLAGPYRLFVGILEGKIAKDSLTGAQYQSVNTLPYPLPLRLLATGEFFIDGDPAGVPAAEPVDGGGAPVDTADGGGAPGEPADDGGVQDEPEEAASAPVKTRELEYNYPTMRLDKPVSVKAFKSYIANQKTAPNVIETIDFIRELSWCVMITEKQLRRFFPKSYQRIAESLFKEGYLTRIEKKSTHDKYYCLSTKGCQICKNEEVRNRVKRSHGLMSRLLIAGDDLKGEEESIEEMACYNDLAVFLDHKLRLKKGYHQFDKKIYNKFPGKIYRRVVMFDSGHGEKILILPSGIMPYFSLEELKVNIEFESNGNHKSTDIVFLYIYDNSVDIDPDMLALLKTRRLYRVSAEDILKEKFCCTDVDGVEHEIRSLFDRKPEAADDEESEVDGEDEIEEGVEEGHEENEDENEESAADEPEEDKATARFEKGVIGIVKLLAEKSIIEAALFAKACTTLPLPEGDLFKTFYWRLSYAINMKMDLPVYASGDIDKLEEDEILITGELLPQDMRILLRLSTFAWALLLPRDQFDYKLYQYRDDVLSDAGKLKEFVPSLKVIFDKLFSLIEILPSGFNFDVIAAFIDKNNLKGRVNDLVNKANAILMLGDPSKKPHVGGTPAWYRACLGNDSELAACVKIMASGDQGKFGVVKAFLEEYGSETQNPAGKYLEKKLNEIKSEVDIVDKYAPNHTIKSGLSTKVERLINIIREWWTITGSLNNNIRKGDTIARTRNELITGINAFLKKTATMSGSSSERGETLRAGLTIIENTFSRILRYLEDGTDVNGKWDYIDLLKSHHIPLCGDSDGGYIPSLKDMGEVPGFEPWNRVLSHIEAEKHEFNTVWDLITNAQGAEPDPDWFKNYGSAQIIEEYLESKGEPAKKSDYPKWIDAAREWAEQDRENFRKDINFEYTFYGRMEKDDRDSILEALNDFNGYFFEETKNFAQYAAFIDALRSRVDYCSDKIGNDFEAKFNELKESRKIDDNVAQKVYGAIEARNFNVVRYIIDHIEKNDANSIKSEVWEEWDKHNVNYLKKFMDGYGRFHAACRKHIHEDGLSWATKHVTTKDEMKSGSSRKLLASWPKVQSAAVEKEKIIELLGNLGFRIEEKSNTQKEPFDGQHNRIMTVYIESSRKNSEAYNHPIAGFGTEVRNPVNVCFLTEEFSTLTELKNFLTDNKLTDSTLILADKAYKLEQRAELAKLLKSEIPGNSGTFLIIDRVLTLYLATLDESVRLPALLQCTLPYTYYQPYMEEPGVRPIAGEMFFGREEDLKQIIKEFNKGVHLICGGKQFGKTALLERACNLEHDPDKGEYAIFVDVREKDAKDALLAISGELKSERNNNIVDAGAEIDSTKQLCDALAKRLLAGEISKLRIYVDGADRYLEGITSDDHKNFNRLREKFPGRFRLVFACLDSTAAVKIPYWRIKPLQAPDARKLLETPLAYLGFQLSGDDLLTILSCTNNYPGLLHQYCHAMVEAARKNHAKYYSGNPPFILDKDRLSGIFDDAGLGELIKKFFNGNVPGEVKIVDDEIAAAADAGEDN